VYHYNLGCVCRDFARPGEARQAFSAALRINPVYAKALFNLAGLTNDPGEALRLLREAGRIDPHDPDLAPAIRMWEELSRLSHAEVVRHRLLWASKDFEQRRYREARLHLALGREGAMDDADRAFSFMVDSDMLRQEGRIAESIVALETAVRLDPGKPHYWNNLGARRLLLCHDRGQPPSDRPGLLERAAQASRKAIALNDYARPHQNLAECYFLRRDLEAAKVEAGKALAMARKQLARAADGELVCAGCTTEGKMTGQCEQCVKKAQDSLRDIDLAAGDYRVT
jgi:tetratricopeptide (TPR) repeat protein